MLGLPDALGRTPDAPLRVLALGAHADDIEIGCGGTLLRLLAERPHAHVRWAVLSASAARADEARASAAAFLSSSERTASAHTVTVADFPDGYFPFEGAAIKRYFESELKGADPHLVLTHARDDRHQDHRLVSDLAWNTWRGFSTIAEYEIPKWDGELERPNAYVRLDTATVEQKVALLLEHFPSQCAKGWFDADTFRGLLRLRGVESAAQWAEAFVCRKLVW